MILSIILMLLLGFILKCDHNNIIDVYSFQPEHSTAMGYVKTKCDDCGKGFGYSLFRDNPTDEKYINVIGEHCKDKIFIEGEYDTVKATVTLADYDFDKTRLNCSVRQGDVEVYFPVTFKGEYEEQVSSIQKGDEITFYGKSALEGLSWIECELITE